MRKAVIFSLMTFMMLFSLLMLSTNFISREKKLEMQSLEANEGDRLRYMTDDLISNVHEDLLSIGPFSLTSNATTEIINFSGGTLSDSLDHAALLAAYENFIEQNYSALTDTNISLSNFTPGFAISPYGSTYLLNRTAATLTTANATNLQKLRIRISVSESLGNELTNSTPPDSGSMPLQVEFFDNQGKELLLKTSANLNPALANSPFEVNFSGGKSLRAKFGNLLGQNGVLLISESSLSAQITLVELSYSPASNITITDGQIFIALPGFSIAKSAPITLEQG